MRTRWVLLCGIALAAVFTLLAGQRSVAWHEDEHSKLAGTWNVTLRFPDCTVCPCPGNTPNIPIPALQSYFGDESIVEAGGGSLFRGPGLGSWERVGHREFAAHFKFFTFKPDGTRSGSEEVTSHINLTGHDTFDATASFDLFDPTGTMKTATGCAINETATRLAGPEE
jgi:hypothetical protein